MLMPSVSADRERFRLSKEVAATGAAALEPSLLDATKLQTSLRGWSIAEILEDTWGGIGGLPQHTQATLNTLAASRGATPPTVRGLPIDDSKLLTWTLSSTAESWRAGAGSCA